MGPGQAANQCHRRSAYRCSGCSLESQVPACAVRWALTTVEVPACAVRVGACAIDVPVYAVRWVGVSGMGRYLDRTYDGVLGPEPYRAYVPHGIAGWDPELSEQTAQRARAVDNRIAGLAAELPQHRSMLWCLNRSEGIASSDVEGVSTTLRSLSLLESLRAARDPQRQERDRQALGAVRLTAHAVSVGRRTDAPVGRRRPVRDAPAALRGLKRWVRAGPCAQRRHLGGARGGDAARSVVRPRRPPAHVGPLCEDLMQYVSAHDLRHPLVKAAVAHPAVRDHPSVPPTATDASVGR